jgi:hypothetical protein
MRVAMRVVALVGVMASASTAYAQGTSSDAVAAQALFDEGRKLMDQRRWSEACPKLAESERLAPSGGTLLNLGECYEHTGQTASAWVAWKDAAARANAAGKHDVEKRALARAGALEGSLARLSIAVDKGSDVEGLQVKRDGVAVGHAEFGMPIPVDPGAHVIEATAPKKRPFSANVSVAAKQTDAQVVVTLADDDSPKPVAAAEPSPVESHPAPLVTPGPEQPAAAKSGWSGQKTVALVVTGAGLVGVALGTVFGLDAKSKNDQALEPQNCRTTMYCTQNGLSLTDDAKSAALASTIAFGAGAAALVAGAVLWFTAPSGASNVGLRATPVVAQRYQGVALDMTW